MWCVSNLHRVLDDMGTDCANLSRTYGISVPKMVLKFIDQFLRVGIPMLVSGPVTCSGDDRVGFFGWGVVRVLPGPSYIPSPLSSADYGVTTRCHGVADSHDCILAVLRCKDIENIEGSSAPIPLMGDVFWSAVGRLICIVRVGLVGLVTDLGCHLHPDLAGTVIDPGSVRSTLGVHDPVCIPVGLHGVHCRGVLGISRNRAI